MTFVDLFAGIGGFRLALEWAGYTCIGFCEKDKYARQTYKANFNTQGEWEGHDITTISDDEIRRIGAVDLICGGFPCQAFSIAGKRQGFDDTRGTLFFEIARFAKILKPRYLFLENVKGLLSHDRGRTFETVLSTLDELGYDAEWQVCNSKDYVPQNRERVFIIGHLRGECTRKIFPFGRTATKTLKQIIPGKDAYRVYNPSGIARTIKSEGGGGGAKTGLYLVAPILTPNRLDKSQNGRRIKNINEAMFTLTAQDRHGVAIYQHPRGKNKGGLHDIAPTLSSHSYQQNNHVMDGMRIRKLTPLECFRLQGFSDEFFHSAKAAGLSDNQLYKQAGNSVTVDVVYGIAKRL